VQSADAFERELKELIISTLKLEGVAPDDIDPAAPLFKEGLGLDSIDALELGVAIQKTYGLRFDANPEETRQHFASVRALAAYLTRAKPLAPPQPQP
jgi:acyl carrier protein